jgi:hypothetical protein
MPKLSKIKRLIYKKLKDRLTRIKYLKNLMLKLNKMKANLNSETKVFLIELIQHEIHTRIISLNHIDDVSIDGLFEDIFGNYNDEVEEETNEDGNHETIEVEAINNSSEGLNN